MTKYFEAGAPPTREEAATRNKALFEDYLSGRTKDGRKLTYRDLGHKYRISFERVRQIVHRELARREKGSGASRNQATEFHRKLAQVKKEISEKSGISVWKVTQIIRLWEATK